MNQQVDLHALGEELLAKARTSKHKTASASVVHGDRQRAVLMAFTPGSGLGEHDTPPAATLHVLRGRARLRCGEQSWDLGAGGLVAIPAARHWLEVGEEETVALLTVTVR